MTDVIGKMGWGDISHGLTAERRALDDARSRLPDRFVAFDVFSREQPRAELTDDAIAAWAGYERTRGTVVGSTLEEKLSKYSLFDEGHEFWSAEEVVYGSLLSPGPQTLGNCFPAGTLIRMADGSHKPIEKMNVLDEVLTAEGRTSSVSSVMSRHIDEPICVVTCWGHHGLRMTAEHPVLTERGYVKACELRQDDWVAFPKYVSENATTLNAAALVENRVRHLSQSRRQFARQKVTKSVGLSERRSSMTVRDPVPDSIALDYSFGRIVGLFLAEGSTCRSKVQWSFAADEEQTLAREVSDTLKRLFGVETTIRVPSGKSVAIVTLSGRDWAFLFEEMCGCGARYKAMISQLTDGPMGFLQGVVTGWLDGDGHARRRRLNGVTVSKRLALQMYDILQASGMMPTIRSTTPKASHGVKSRQQRWDIEFRESAVSDHWRGKQDDTHVWRKIRTLSQEEYHGHVFNFSVIGDESYVAEGMGVHNCVGYSHIMLLMSRIAWEVLVSGEPEEPVLPFVGYSYGAGRVYAGGNRLRGDGSLCSWQIEGSLQHGFLPCFVEYDTQSPRPLKNASGDTLRGPFPQGSTSVCRQFGSSKSTLDKWRPIAKEFKLESSTDINTTDELIEAVVDKKTPCQICSNWGFGASHFDNKYGFWVYRRSGSWAHSMQIVAVFKVKGTWFAYVRNQWGWDAHKDPGNGMPKGGFIIPLELMATWLRQAHCATISSIRGRESDPGFTI